MPDAIWTKIQLEGLVSAVCLCASWIRNGRHAKVRRTAVDGSFCGTLCAPPSPAAPRRLDNSILFDPCKGCIALVTSARIPSITSCFMVCEGKGALVQAHRQALSISQFSANSGCRPCWIDTGGRT